MKAQKTKITQSLVLGLISVSGITSTAHAETDPYIEQSGRLVVEVESEPSGDTWSRRNDIYGYTGDGFLVWNGINNFAKNEATRGEAITYSFRIATAGNYQLRWRSRNSVGLDATEHNDSWVQFPSGTNIEGEEPLDGWTKAYMGQVAKWTWDVFTVDGNNRPIRQFFEAGEHTIEIAGRSNGHAVDRFVLYRYDEEDFDVALFDALASSPRDSEEAIAAHDYTGNSCYAGELSLAAQHSMQYSESNTQTTLLSFEIPEISDEAISLRLTGEDGALDQTVYLGSNSNWADDSTAELPAASVLLATFADDVSNGTIQSVDIEASLLTSGVTTLVMLTDEGDAQSPLDIGTRQEPRLQITVGDAFCSEYNSVRTSGSEIQGSPVEQPEVNETSNEGSSEEGTNEEEPSEETTTDGQTNGEPTVDEESRTEPGVDVATPVVVQPSVDETVSEEITVSAGTDTTGDTSSTSSSRSSGALGYWSLLLLGFVAARARRLRCG